MRRRQRERPADGCRRYIFDALVRAMDKRDTTSLDWIERERTTVAVAANEWATSHGGRTVTVEDVERVEVLAVGHVDYARKLALYVAELTCAGVDGDRG